MAKWSEPLFTADAERELRAENERLREALCPKPEKMVELVDEALHNLGRPQPAMSKQELRTLVYTVNRLSIKRAALQENQE